MSFGNYGGVQGHIVGAYTTTVNRGGMLKLLAPDASSFTARFREFMRITQLETVFEIFGNEADAIRSFGIEPIDLQNHYSIVLTVDAAGRIGAQVVEKFAGEVSETTIVRPALHGIMFPDHAFFPSGELDDFAKLINQNPPAKEAAFQEFLESHPRWLYLLGEQYEHAIPQVALPPLELRSALAFADGTPDRAAMVPDFLVKRVGLDLWDVLDIKTADARVVVGGQSRRRFSSAVAEAVAQLREYSRRLRSPQIREYLFERYRMTVSEPMAMIVIGRDFSFRNHVEKDRFREQDGVKVYTYDDLYRLAKRRALPAGA